jgi:hypothetical protein
MAMLSFFAFGFQGLLIAVDEFVCHRSRYLPNWELAGHPIDTLFLFIYFLFLFFVSPVNMLALTGAAIVGAVSTLITTKDEWVHKEFSSGFENWLHSLLFITHGVLVLSLFILWSKAEVPQRFLEIALTAVGGFFLYQCWEGFSKWQKA